MSRVDAEAELTAEFHHDRLVPYLDATPLSHTLSLAVCFLDTER
jgi:hypothetical protein